MTERSIRGVPVPLIGYGILLVTLIIFRIATGQVNGPYPWWLAIPWFVGLVLRSPLSWAILLMIGVVDLLVTLRLAVWPAPGLRSIAPSALIIETILVILGEILLLAPSVRRHIKY